MIKMMRNMIKAKADPYGVKTIDSTFQPDRGVKAIRAVLNNGEKAEMSFGAAGDAPTFMGPVSASTPMNRKILREMNEQSERMSRSADLPESARSAYQKASKEIEKYIMAAFLSTDIKTHDTVYEMGGPA